jgi:hypothetical protein
VKEKIIGNCAACMKNIIQSDRGDFFILRRRGELVFFCKGCGIRLTQEKKEEIIANVLHARTG